MVEGGIGSLRFEGRVALVTGAARNIGAATARRLAAEGAALAVHYHARDSRADAEAIVEEIAAHGGQAMAIEADIAQEADVRAMVAAVENTLGGPTILVNNAAASVTGATPWYELEPEDWDQVLRTNITGAFLCARAVHPFMQRGRWGRIIAMGSVRSPLGRPGNVHYTASKSALEGMGRVLAREMGPDEITVNTIIVGAIRTPAEAAYGDPNELDRALLDCQAIKRRGEPSDVAGLVAFLASRDADFITGQSITVDGGWVMR
jgi:NAD(P)-dependent dehydrogenase (short-subunit alcohol dehydrogenase family)